MTIRAVIFDVYSTILEVGPAPADAEIRWQRLFAERFHTAPRWTRLEFAAACSQVIARRHEWARVRGIAWPEIHWPTVVTELLPELAGSDDLDGFILGHIQTGRTLRMPSDAALTLTALRDRGILLGIASNSQAYTLEELGDALRGHGLGIDLFAPDLCFWSFEHGFSKPEPHAFQFLTHRLAARGIAPAEILMVGDRLDNDIAPARAFGWKTWHLADKFAETPGGGWRALRHHLDALPSSAA